MAPALFRVRNLHAAIACVAGVTHLLAGRKCVDGWRNAKKVTGRKMFGFLSISSCWGDRQWSVHIIRLRIRLRRDKLGLIGFVS